MAEQRIILDFDPDGIRQLRNDRITSDVTGSYTGQPEDPYETPVQDADDL